MLKSNVTTPWKTSDACTDPWIFAGGGGGGGSMPSCQVKADIFFVVFLVLNLFYSFTEGVQWLFQRKLLFSKGSNYFQGGPTFARGGPNANFYRNPYNL